MYRYCIYIWGEGQAPASRLPSMSSWTAETEGKGTNTNKKIHLYIYMNM